MYNKDPEPTRISKQRYTTMKAHADDVHTKDLRHTVDLKNEQRDNSMEVHAEQSTLSMILANLVHQQRQNALPTPQLEIFDGKDMIEFPTFMRNYRYMVEANTEDPVRRMELLIRYTSNEPRDLISNCVNIEPPEEGYKRAMYLLKREYGQPALLATAYKSKAEAWQNIKSGDRAALHRFYIFIANLSSAKIANRELDSTDGYEFLKILAAKLPIPLQQQWIREVGRHRERNLSPTLLDFESFVGQLARDENDPRIAGLGYQSRNSQIKTSDRDRSRRGNARAFATSVKTEGGEKPNPAQRQNIAMKWPCSYNCHGPRHGIAECRKFSYQKPDDKSVYCRQNGFCYGCMNPGHVKGRCPNPDWASCKKCDRNHATVLHDSSRDKTKDTVNQPGKSTKQQVKHDKTNKSTDNSTRGHQVNVNSSYINPANMENGSSPLMTIVPVLVKAKERYSVHRHICFH